MSFHPAWAEDQGPGGHPLFQNCIGISRSFHPAWAEDPGPGGRPLLHSRSGRSKFLRPFEAEVQGSGGLPLFQYSHSGTGLGGLPLFQTTTPSIGSSPRRANDQGRGASPFVTALPGEPDVEAAGRCHYPGAVSTVSAGAGPYLRPGADSPLFHRLPIPVPSDRTRSPPHDVPVHNTRNSGLG